MFARSGTRRAAIFAAALILKSGTAAAAPVCSDAFSKRFLSAFQRDLRGNGKVPADRPKFAECEDHGRSHRVVPHLKEDAKGRILLDPSGAPILEGLLQVPANSARAFADYETQLRRYFAAKFKSRLPRRRDRAFNRVSRRTVDRINAGGLGLENVAELQDLLGVEADGIVGAETALAFGRFHAAYAESGMGAGRSAAPGPLPALSRDVENARRLAERNRWSVPAPGSSARSGGRRTGNLIEFVRAFGAAREAVGLPAPGRPTASLPDRSAGVWNRPTLTDRLAGAVDDAVRPVAEFFDGLSNRIAEMVPWVRGTVRTKGPHYGKNARMVGAGLYLPPRGLGYRSTTRQRWGTGRMIRLIQYTGAYAHQQGLPDLEIRDISKEGGGRLGGHHSHRIGLDADLRNFFTPGPMVWQGKGKKRRKVRSYSFDTEKNWVMLRGILQYRVEGRRGSPVEFVFTSQGNKNKLLAYAKKRDPAFYREAARVLNVEPNHGGHFHVRLYN